MVCTNSKVVQDMKELGKMMPIMETESLFILMVIDLKDTLNRVRRLQKEFIFIKMDHNIKENGIGMREVVKELCIMLMVMNMMVDGKMENVMVWDYTNIQMEINMREILLAIKNMVEVL